MKYSEYTVIMSKLMNLSYAYECYNDITFILENDYYPGTTRERDSSEKDMTIEQLLTAHANMLKLYELKLKKG